MAVNIPPQAGALQPVLVYLSSAVSEACPSGTAYDPTHGKTIIDET